MTRKNGSRFSISTEHTKFKWTAGHNQFIRSSPTTKRCLNMCDVLQIKNLFVFINFYLPFVSVAFILCVWIVLCQVTSVPLLDSFIFFPPQFKVVNKLNRRTESMAIRCIPLCIMNRAHDLQSLVCLCTHHTPYTMDWLTLKLTGMNE